MSGSSSLEGGPGAADRSAHPALEARGLSKRFGATRALQDASLVLQHAEIHALVGRNGAGKSTLVSLLTGLVEPDSGTILVSGKPAPRASDPAAWRRVVACVYQRPALVPQLTVAENLLLNRYPGQRWGAFQWRLLRQEAASLLAEWEIDVDERLEASLLTVQQRQLVEIAAALSTGARVLILDEPTAELDAREVQKLFERIRTLRQAGVSFIFISHYLDEIFDLCDSATVLRDGRVVAHAPVRDLSRGHIIEAMVGRADTRAELQREVSHVPPESEQEPLALEVRNLSLGKEFRDISLTVRPGECVGLGGLAGSGRNAVAHVLGGLKTADAGTVHVNGREVRLGSVPRAISAGIGLVPEDRHAAGFVPEMSIEDNITMSWWKGQGRAGFVVGSKRQEVVERMMDGLEVAAASHRQSVISLSGGNQQKVVFGRTLATEPKVIVLCHPTSGVDIASKAALLGAVERLLQRGAAVLIVSDDLEELLVCSRVHVMRAGRIAHMFPAGWAARELVAVAEGAADE